MNNINVLIVGCGKAAGLYENDSACEGVNSHATAYRKHGKFDLVACVDSNPDRAREFASKFDIPTSGSDIRSMLELHRIDVVSVTSPDQTHYQITLDVFKYGPDVRLIFLEKPACQTLWELDRLVMESASQNIPVVVNHSRRFDSVYQNIQRDYNDGKYGDLLQFDAHYYGGWLHNGTHLVDLIGFLFSDELVNHNVVDILPTERLSDPTLTVRSELGASKVPIRLHGWHDDYYQVFDIEIRFSKGRLKIENFETHMFWEESVMNRSGECVLGSTRIDLRREHSSPNLAAASLIARYLETGNRTLLEGVELRDAITTMQTMWNIETLA